MTPFRVVAVRRWEVVVAFLAVAASYVVGLWALHTADVRTHRVAASAKTLAIQLAATAKATRALRGEQVAELHAAADRDCGSRHRLTVVLRDLVGRSLSQEQHPAPFPGLTVAQQAALTRSRRQSAGILRRFLFELRGADCVAVPPLTVHP